MLRAHDSRAESLRLEPDVNACSLFAQQRMGGNTGEMKAARMELATLPHMRMAQHKCPL